MKNYIYALLGILLFSCGKKETTPQEAPAQGTTKAVRDITNQEAESYPSISEAEMTELVTRTNLVDYIFYELPMSMNLDNPGAINSALRQISSKPAKIFPDCKPMGRVIFQDHGDIFKEADFYFENPCFGFVFIEDNKKTKSNMMTEEGAKFFKNLLDNARQTHPQQSGGQ